MPRKVYARKRSVRRISVFRRWWGDIVFRWRTSRRAPWILGGTSAFALALFTSVMHAMVTGDAERKEIACLAMNVYYEARGETVDGQYAVAEVTMNRVSDSRYPDTVCQVVYQERWDYLRKRHVSAFSWTEFDSVPHPEGLAWKRAKSVANATFHGERQPVLDGAVHYHADHIRPSWSVGKKQVAKIGRHVFYR